MRHAISGARTRSGMRLCGAATMGRTVPDSTRGAPMASKTSRTKPKLLAGGNPQIPKGYGDEPVQAWIAATPDWKQEIARWVDAAVTRAVPRVRKAVKYNSPLYGADGREDW